MRLPATWLTLKINFISGTKFVYVTGLHSWMFGDLDMVVKIYAALATLSHIFLCSVVGILMTNWWTGIMYSDNYSVYRYWYLICRYTGILMNIWYTGIGSDMADKLDNMSSSEVWSIQGDQITLTLVNPNRTVTHPFKLDQVWSILPAL